VGTRPQRAASVVVPRRCSVLRYASAPAPPRTCCAHPPRGNDLCGTTAKSLDQLSDDEWWTYCAPGIVLGMNGVTEHDVGGRRPAIDSRFTSPIIFYSDEPTECSDETPSRATDGPWTQRVLNFDEL